MVSVPHSSTGQVLQLLILSAGFGFTGREGLEVCGEKGATVIGVLERKVREGGEKELGFVLSQKLDKLLQGPTL